MRFARRCLRALSRPASHATACTLVVGEVEMYWECGECGGVVERERPSVVCPVSGVAATPMVPAESNPAELASMRESWLRAGFESELFETGPRAA